MDAKYYRDFCQYCNVDFRPTHTETGLAVYKFVSYRHFVKMDLVFCVCKTLIFFKPGSRVDESKNNSLVFSCVQPIHIFFVKR